MSNLLTGGLARIIGVTAAPFFLNATLTRDGATTGASFDPVAGTPTSYTCKAVVETYAERFRFDGLVEQNDRKVIILANSLSVRPQPNDRITISGITFTVIEVATDPAEACWECRGRM